MSGMLNQFGLVKFLSDSVAASLAAMHLSWPVVVRLPPPRPVTPPRQLASR